MKHLLIASTGRTGTTYLESIFSCVDSVAVKQEPPPSRVLYMLSNLSAVEIPIIEQGASRGALCIYVNTRRRWMRKCRKSFYIEINPFLSNLLPDIVYSQVVPDAVLHIVRNPVSWVKSMIRFGAYSWRRLLVPYLPYVYFRPPYGAPGWGKLSFAQRLAHEWNYRNKRILDAKAGIQNYSLLRYEDLFQGKRLNMKLLAQTIDSLGFEIRELGLVGVSAEQANSSQIYSGKEIMSEEDCRYIEEVTTTLSAQFGYN